MIVRVTVFDAHRLDGVIEAGALIGAEIDADSRLAWLRLRSPAVGQPGTPPRERVLLLHGVSRVAGWLRRVRYEAGPRWQPGPGEDVRVPHSVDPPVAVQDVWELNDWLHRWSGHELYGQPGEIFDATDGPGWLDWPSLDVAWTAGGHEVHTLDLWLGDNASVGALMLDLHIEFEHLETLTGAADDPWRRSGRPRIRREGWEPAPARAKAARGRRWAAVAVIAALAAAGSFAVPWATGHPRRLSVPAQPVAAPRPLPAVESGLLPWRLPVPISREVVVARPAKRLIVLGGLTAAGRSANGVFSVQIGTGRLARIGALRAPVHDAAAAALGRRALVFGGGAIASVATVQAFTSGGHSPARTAARTGSLPTPRSDAAAVTIGSTAYIVGGYDGARPDAQVLATSDGRSFTAVARLPVPVRYPAVAALRGQILVFGGQAITGPHAGRPVSIIQAVTPAQHTAAIVGHLPEPLSGAAAVTVGNHVFVAGGESTRPQHVTPGLGTTQFGPAGGGASASAPRTFTVPAIWAFDPAAKRLVPAGRLQVPVSHAGVAVCGSTAWLVGGERGGVPVASVQMLRPNRAFGTAGAPGAGSPYFGGRLLIADRGNNRLLLLNDRMHIVWRYPSPATPPDRLGFYFPDDAFFIAHGTAILSNQEQNQTIVKIAYPSGRIIWSYGHPGRASSAAGYLHEPDDAYLLKNGQVAVADANNCRVLVINAGGTVAHQIGTSGVCVHHPPSSMGTPNGDTPLPDGNLLVSEINGAWVSEYTPTGKLVWTAHLPISYPSDPQQLGGDRYLIADYALPGQILVFNRSGRVRYRYHATSGPGVLNHPSLAELLPSGVFMVNDDYNDRMVAIDPATGALVWQYGVTGSPGTAPGRLHTPDGFDLLMPNGSTPTHTSTG